MPKKIKWTKEKIKDGFISFHDKHNRYPTAREIDSYSKLPSSRQIQRNYGGLVSIRKSLGLKGPVNFTTEKYSLERSKKINKENIQIESDVYKFLINHFGKEFVHRKYFLYDDGRNQTDFFIYYNDGNLSIDTIYPKDRHSFTGCLNSKIKNYKPSVNFAEMIFLIMNPELKEKKIDKLIENKKNKIPTGCRVMTIDKFKKFCLNKKPLTGKRG